MYICQFCSKVVIDFDSGFFGFKGLFGGVLFSCVCLYVYCFVFYVGGLGEFVWVIVLDNKYLSVVVVGLVECYYCGVFRCNGDVVYGYVYLV